MKRTWIKIGLGLVMVSSLCFFLKATDFTHLFRLLPQMGSSYLPILGVTFLAALAATLGWKQCLGKAGNGLSFATLFWLRHMGETLSLLNPAGVIGGDGFKLMLLQEKGVPTSAALVSLVLSRAFMILSQLGLLCCMVVLLFDFPGLFHFSGKGMWYFFVGFGTLVLLLLYIQRNKVLLTLPFLKENTALGRKVATAHAHISKGKQQVIRYFIQHPFAVLGASFWFTLHWMLGAAEFYLILKFLQVPVGFLAALFLDLGVVLFKSLGMFIPAQVGVEEYGNKTMLATLGITSTEIWLAVSLLRRARQLFWLVVGLVTYFFWEYGRRVSKPTLDRENGSIVRQP